MYSTSVVRKLIFGNPISQIVKGLESQSFEFLVENSNTHSITISIHVNTSGNLNWPYYYTDPLDVQLENCNDENEKYILNGGWIQVLKDYSMFAYTIDVRDSMYNLILKNNDSFDKEYVLLIN